MCYYCVRIFWDYYRCSCVHCVFCNVFLIITGRNIISSIMCFMVTEDWVMCVHTYTSRLSSIQVGRDLSYKFTKATCVKFLVPDFGTMWMTCVTIINLHFLLIVLYWLSNKVFLFICFNWILRNTEYIIIWSTQKFITFVYNYSLTK